MSHHNHEPTPNCTGVVKFWSRMRGYGFIHQCANYPGLDIIVHYSEIDDDGGRGSHMDLYEHQRVMFDAVRNIKNGRYRGMKAVNVKVLRN